MKTKYQLLFLGKSEFQEQIIHLITSSVKDLGLDSSEVLSIIDELHFASEYKANNPTVCIFFGGEKVSDYCITIVDKLLIDAVFILPAVDDLTIFSQLVPTQLKGINGLNLKDESNIPALISSVLEGFSLLRKSRRLFISYRRMESRSIAIQLYEHLDSCGFDVFLDTHSIRPGDDFQEELWQRLVDTDVVVLLDTPGFMESKWTAQELAKASAMSIGILQLVWPDHAQKSDASLCFPIFLTKNSFDYYETGSEANKLSEEKIKSIASQVESLRARCLAARQDNLIQEFTAAARNLNIEAYLQPEKFLTLSDKLGTEFVVIPSIGVPQAFTYNQKHQLIKTLRESAASKVFLLFDNRNIRENWISHLDWLDGYLPVKTIKSVEIEKWMKTQNL